MRGCFKKADVWTGAVERRWGGIAGWDGIGVTTYDHSKEWDGIRVTGRTTLFTV